MSKIKPPENCEVEVTVFGPGYGECILIHVGSNQWVVMDSCVGKDKEPVALTYLKSIGCNPDQCVQYVIATHWHDDHVQGISKVLESAGNATFFISTALGHREFIAFLKAHERQPSRILNKGGSEMLASIKIAKSRNTHIKFAHENTIVAGWDKGVLEHGQTVEIRALSPAPLMVEDFLVKIGGNLSSLPGTTKKRITDRGKNDLSIASLLTVGSEPFFAWSRLGRKRQT